MVSAPRATVPSVVRSFTANDLLVAKAAGQRKGRAHTKEVWCAESSFGQRPTVRSEFLEEVEWQLGMELQRHGVELHHVEMVDVTFGA